MKFTVYISINFDVKLHTDISFFYFICAISASCSWLLSTALDSFLMQVHIVLKLFLIKRFLCLRTR